MTCPICGAPIDQREARHVADCEAIEMGLLADQLTPEVTTLPQGFKYWR